MDHRWQTKLLTFNYVTGKNTSVFRTCKRPFYSCLLSSLAYHVPHILYTRTAHAPRHSAIVPLQHLCRSQRFSPFGRWSKGSNLREGECGNTGARKKGVINAVGIGSCSFRKLAIKDPASLNFGSLEKRSNQPKYKEPKRRSPKTTAKLIQNKVYFFFLPLFLLTIPAFFTDVTELM